MIHPDRIVQDSNLVVNGSGKYVLYWMQGAQRTVDNHALALAIQLANQHSCSVLVAFVVTPSFPNGNMRHFRFMLEGLIEIEEKLRALNIGFVIRVGEPLRIIPELAQEAVLVVMDNAYEPYGKTIRTKMKAAVRCGTFVVDTNLMIPVASAYPKEAYAAYAIRPAIMRRLFDYVDHPQLANPNIGFSEKIDTLSLIDVDSFMALHLNGLEYLSKSSRFISGEDAALWKLALFVENGLDGYATNQSSPAIEGTSMLSPYLHFGQISPLTILKSVLASEKNADAFIEQLVVRRELAYNFVYYSESDLTDLSNILPNWAMETLAAHKHDLRETLYTLEVLEQASTHDEFWNAAQEEMMVSGHMHNTMRMYWGKKIIEWTNSPEDAYAVMRYLNDKYQLDGRDPNGYAGIAWCFGKHDRPWQERPIFGKVRYMNYAGLNRKYDMKGYLTRVRQL